MHIFNKKLFLFLSTLIVLFSQISIAYASTVTLSENKSLYYTDVGDGAPLILIHAFPTDHRLWDPQQEKLKKYFRVITIDLLGFGKSTLVDGNAISMNDYASNIKVLMDKLRIKNAVIAGESMGGYVALALLNQYPNKVAGLILSNTQAIADNANAKAKREATAKNILENGTTDFVNAFLLHALTDQASEETKSSLRHIVMSQSAKGMASGLRGMSERHDLSSLLSRTSLPILIITSDHDQVISPQQSEDMHKLAKNSKLITIKNAGHLSNLEQADAWNQAAINMFYLPPVN